MRAMSEEIRIRFFGAGVSPSTIDARDVAALISKYCDSTRAIIRLTDPEEAKGDVLLCLTDIKNQSLGLVFRASVSLLAAHMVLSDAMREGNIAALPEPAIEFAKSVRKFASDHHCVAEFYDSGSPAPRTVISEVSVFETDIDAPLVGRTILYGKLERIGGSEPRAAILVGTNNERLHCRLSEKQAIELGSRLYKQVGLECETSWDWRGRRGSDYKLRDVIAYSPSIRGLEAMREALAGAPANVEWPDDED